MSEERHWWQNEDGEDECIICDKLIDVKAGDTRFGVSGAPAHKDCINEEYEKRGVKLRVP